MKKRKDILPLLLGCLLMSLLFLYPYLLCDRLNLEHDTFFHLSRIEGLAQSFCDGVFLPRIYPYKNAGFGYGSPLFYSDFFLVLPALLYLAGVSLKNCAVLFLFGCSFFSSFFMALCIRRLSSHQGAAYLGAFLYLFSTYRMTDVYVRGAYGEVLAFVFLPLVLLGAFELLKGSQKRGGWILTCAFSGLVLSHNITFLLGCLLLGSILIINLKALKLKTLAALFKAALITLALTAFFTFPMLEQMLDHTMIVHYYASGSDLASSALNAWQFFRNQLIFGYAGNTGSPDSLMTTNPGWFLTFVPLAYFFLKNRMATPEKHFVNQCLKLGYFFLFLCSAILPWKYMGVLSVLQFPWRFLTLSCTLLVLPAAIVPFELIPFEKPVLALTLIISAANGIYLLTPVLERTFFITSQTSYQQIIDGTLIDPYYSATYMRVELAGGDYLPWPSVDYRELDSCLYTQQMEALSCEVQRDALTLRITLNQRAPQSTLIAPLTWYKGYQAYAIQKGETIRLDTFLDESSGLTAISVPELTEDTVLLVRYEKTGVQKISEIISLAALLWLLIYSLSFSKRKDSSFHKQLDLF